MIVRHVGERPASVANGPESGLVVEGASDRSASSAASTSSSITVGSRNVGPPWTMRCPTAMAASKPSTVRASPPSTRWSLRLVEPALTVRTGASGGKVGPSSPRLGHVDALDVESTRRRLVAANGGYEIVHTSPGLKVGIYVLVAPEPDHQEAHQDDELYVVLEGRGVLTIEGEPIAVKEGKAVFVPAGVDHRFTGYEGLSVLVIFARRRP